MSVNFSLGDKSLGYFDYCLTFVYQAKVTPYFSR